VCSSDLFISKLLQNYYDKRKEVEKWLIH